MLHYYHNGFVNIILYFMTLWRYGEPLPEEVKDFPLTVFLATCVGFMFGGLIGSRHTGDKFIAMNHHSKFSSTMQAQVLRIYVCMYVCALII